MVKRDLRKAARARAAGDLKDVSDRAFQAAYVRLDADERFERGHRPRRSGSKD